MTPILLYNNYMHQYYYANTGHEFPGLWHRHNHSVERTKYLHMIEKHYGHMPLVECDIAISLTANTH